MKVRRTLCVVFGTLIALPLSRVVGEICAEMTLVEAYAKFGLYFLIPYLLLWLGLGLTVYGCYLWAKLKGRHWAWMFLGLFTPIGLIFLLFLKNKSVGF